MSSAVQFSPIAPTALKKKNKWINDAPIKVKLVYICFLVVIITLVSTTASMVAFQIKDYRQTLLETMIGMTEISAANVGDVLVSQDVTSIQQGLNAFAEIAKLNNVTLTDMDGQVVAEYGQKLGNTGQLPEYLKFAGDSGRGNQYYFFSEAGLRVIVPVFFEEEQVGELAVLSDLALVYAHIGSLLTIAMGVLFAAMIIAYVLIERLQDVVSRPLLAFKSEVEGIRKSHDFSVQMPEDSKDEIGMLAQGFNEMLYEIKQRDERLSLYRDNIDNLVEEKTRSLTTANAVLTKTLTKLTHAKENAELTSKSKTMFMALMKDEINTRMDTILGLSTLLERTELDHNQAHYIQSTREASESLLNTTHDVLAYAKIADEKIALHPDELEFELNQELNDNFDNVVASLEQVNACVIQSESSESLIGQLCRYRNIRSVIVPDKLLVDDVNHALEKNIRLQTSATSFVLIDGSISLENSLAYAKKIRQVNAIPNLPVILVLDSFEQYETVAKCLLNNYFCLTHQVRPEELYACLHKILFKTRRSGPYEN